MTRLQKWLVAGALVAAALWWFHRRRQARRRRNRGRACSRRVWRLPKQRITSRATALRQVPALHKKVRLGRLNVDIGGGPYDDASRYLRRRGTRNVVYDPFNRSGAENQRAQAVVCGGRADTATVANVLNVVGSRAGRRLVIEQAADAIKASGTAFFQIYEGDRTGRGGATPRGWQENRVTGSYLPEVRAVFRDVRQRGNVLVARSPR